MTYPDDIPCNTCGLSRARVETSRSIEDRFHGYEIHLLECGHDETFVLEWCRDCRALKAVVEVDNEAQGQLDGHGEYDIMRVIYLECGHDWARSTGERSSVL